MKSGSRIKTELLANVHATMQEMRNEELKSSLISWADEPETDRGVLFGKNSLHFGEKKPFYVIVMETVHGKSRSEVFRGESRSDACAQALQYLEAHKVKVG